MPALRAAVIGAAGYGGIELVRHLLGHPFFELIAASSDRDTGLPLAELYPALLDRTALSFVPHEEVLALARDGRLEAVFLAVPHTAALSMVPDLLEDGVSVFDLSADFRLKNPTIYERWYGVAHTASDLLAHAVYGLPELYRSQLAQAGRQASAQETVRTSAQASARGTVRTSAQAGAQETVRTSAQAGAQETVRTSAQASAQGTVRMDAQAGAPVGMTGSMHARMRTPALVACPGCYPTASALAAAPALAAGITLAAPVVVNAISGVSGAGRKANATTHFCSVDDNVNAYGVTTHRHTPEIIQIFSTEAGRTVPVVFTPHLAPLKRGLLATVTLSLQTGVDAEILETVYLTAYEGEAFVRLLPFGTMPRTASVLGSNCAQVGIAFDAASNTLIASCAIDNLGKGAATQAIQCANIVFGFKETVGLIGIPPVV
ncbi:MAG: N-acetyl-gamma-glutamyl-phosphate reductase [Coriobacteriales bacterium]|jgi:N-acetyl-gamma-glutamylphosphate reductase|nr:N-acetyl-gamma-glutamyl-phosphate reductase [Coriobacteriales bacterium]